MRIRTHSRFTIGFFLAVLAATAAVAQSPRTISHQGVLTNNAGTPVPDDSRNMAFGIYDAESGGSPLWSETKSVSTVNGRYGTILGSSTPITGVDFSQPLWLGVKVGTDSEMERTPLTGVPYALGLVMPFNDTMMVMTSNLGTDFSERHNEDVTVYANDAIMALYSNPNGVSGSGITLGEIDGIGELEDKWAMYRRTKGGNGELRFTYGPNGSQASNPIMVAFDTLAGVSANVYKYSEKKTSYATIGAAAFAPVVSGAAGYRTSLGHADAGGPSQLTAPIQLPHGARIESFECLMYDVSASSNMSCSLYRTGAGLSQGTEIASVATTGSSGYQSPDDNISEAVNNTLWANMVYLEVPSWGTVTSDVRILKVIVTYEMDEVP